MRLALLVLWGIACGEAGSAPPTEERSQPEGSSRAATPSRTATPQATTPLTLWIGGDVLLSEAIRDYARSFDDPAQGMARVLAPAARLWTQDRGAFVLVNLELPVPDRRRFALDRAPANPHGYTAVRLSGPTWLLPALARSGIHAVSLANNHALDQGRAGLSETIANANAAGLLVTGAGRYPNHRWPLVLGEEGHEVAVVALYDGRGQRFAEAGDPTVSHLDEEGVALVATCAERYAAVVVVVHVLGELVREPEPQWRAWAERLAAAGASAILVHGTHVVMPVERVAGVPVAWGLGNLVSDMGRLASPVRPYRPGEPKARSPWVREALLARLRFEGDTVELRFLPAWMSDDRYARWHADLPGGDLIELQLLPLGPGRDAALLPPWPEPYRGRVARWVASRRDALLEAAHLSWGPPDASGRRWLLPAFAAPLRASDRR